MSTQSTTRIRSGAPRMKLFLRPAGVSRLVASTLVVFNQAHVRYKLRNALLFCVLVFVYSTIKSDIRSASDTATNVIGLHFIWSVYREWQQHSEGSADDGDLIPSTTTETPTL